MRCVRGSTSVSGLPTLISQEQNIRESLGKDSGSELRSEVEQVYESEEGVEDFSERKQPSTMELLFAGWGRIKTRSQSTSCRASHTLEDSKSSARG